MKTKNVEAHKQLEKNSNGIGFHQLPHEIIVYVLLNLDWRSVLNVQRVRLATYSQFSTTLYDPSKIV